ncbi:MAG: ATP-binding protein [Sphingobacteriia bacterium]|jgi:two-component system, sporulation sensor kinase D|nr:ATP-binding protein [Paludibacteraceae bacterium]NCA78785.1 ATP-binding protein [Sphingobacteriia bacterium]
MTKKNYYLKLAFGIVAILIVGASLLFSNKLVDNVANEERQKMEGWAEATRLFVSVDNNSEYFDFLWQIIEQNENIPVIIVDDNDDFISARNFNAIPQDTAAFYEKKIQELKYKNEPIEITIHNGEHQYLYYDDSILLKQLAYYPYIQLVIVSVFLIVVFMSFAGSKRAEQNKVWVGLSKETAHQLGTPISSLLAWVEILKSKHADDSIINEMGKDINRLRTIAERFSKIGSKPEFIAVDFVAVVENSIAYMKSRSSDKVVFEMEKPSQVLVANINVQLLEWVIENLCKNAIDAMDGKGNISVKINADNHNIVMDFSDTGKGIDKKDYKNIFRPGFTTKKRGWGLGLSLARRIVRDYHHGRIFITTSEKNVGTTFRVVLPIANR